MSNISPSPIFNETSGIRRHMKIGRYGELECEHCNKAFNQSLDGLIEMTFHILLAHGDILNPPDPKGKFVVFTSDREYKAKTWVDHDS